jgi:hypothetical protein
MTRSLRCLHRELIDEQEWLAGLDIVKQFLQLVDVAARNDAQETRPGCGPCRSIWDDNTLPPSFVTAAVTRCNSATPATVTFAPSMDGDPRLLPGSAGRVGFGRMRCKTFKAPSRMLHRVVTQF